MGLGTTEIIIIILIALLLFGASRIADIGKGLGEGIRNFKKGIRGEDDDDDKPFKELKDKPKADDAPDGKKDG